MDVAFVGLGNMGSPMARHLIEAGHKLTVYNRTRSRAEPLQDAGERIQGDAMSSSNQGPCSGPSTSATPAMAYSCCTLCASASARAA